MLDSSPVSIPQSPRPMKRSASVASLPTPPRTHHKRKRAASKQSRGSHDDLTATDEEDDETLVKEAEDEESFWMTANAASTSRNAPPPLLYRRLQAHSQTQLPGVAPVSPPPSHRKPPVKAGVIPRTPTPQSVSTVSPPSTPPAKRRKVAAAPLPRDSPDNPFLASPLGSQDEIIVAESDTAPSSQEEKPTMALVFRGVRRTFPNPYYDPSSSGPNPKSQLPPEHPDFEPDERGVRKLLFGVGRKSAAPKKTGSKSRRVAETTRGRQGRRPTAGASSAKSDEDVEEKDMKPLKFSFAA
ncbi:hypothetical protein B0H15DRAFT_825528 [Mycena belliarum]|uniref:Uncharacterized protein n=1 Tax=Mycena belliarum TaxID=1033014 RepID=A0AAD6XSH6_9AGAR|nr:hypothetical protein B0H15DRAFT_825528 [Mycena belliae]